MDPDLLALLCCPVTRQPLRLLTAAEAAALKLPEPGPVLLRTDGQLYYHFDELGFPLLLPGSGKPVPRGAITSTAQA